MPSCGPHFLSESWPRPGFGRPLIVAHRGARRQAPENTLAAARRAWELGADAWELDVNLSADGALTVTHDDTLERVTDAAARPDLVHLAPWRVCDLTLGQFNFEIVHTGTRCSGA